MDEQNTQPNTPNKPVNETVVPQEVKKETSSRGGFGKGGRGTDRDGGKGKRRSPMRRGPRADAAKPEFEQKMIAIRRVARVVSGGRRFSFAVALIAGDKNGRVGVGTGKAGDTSLAIEKAFKSAKKNMVTIKRTKEGSIPHGAEAKYSSGKVYVMPAPGRGIVAGSSARNVLELAGIKDVGAKVLSPSKNKLNVARATIEALKRLRSPRN